jgi:hypothetical protein
MAKAWVSIEGAQQRFELAGGHMILGGPHSVFPIPGAGGDSLHLFDDPPKLVYVGGGERPRVNGTPVEELELAPGDTIQWRGVSFTFGCEGAPVRLPELPPEEVASAPAVASPQRFASPPQVASPAGRRAARAAVPARRPESKGGGWFMFVFIQVFMLLLSSAILFVTLFVVRVRWGVSIDELMDDLASFLRSLG